MSGILCFVEHENGAIVEASLEALTLARDVAAGLGADLSVMVVGDSAGVAGDLGAYGVATVHGARHPILSDYGPEAWGETLRQLVAAQAPEAVVAAGTERGNEVMAQLAARLDRPMVANCIDIDAGEQWEMTRVQWGGSLLERAQLQADVKLVTVAPHAVAAEPAASSGPATTSEFEPDLDDTLARTVVRDRVTVSEGITLATAPVVVAGGRGVGSSDGFALLDELAGLLGGAVGCSRVVTNSGWRPHSDQVGQTGTRVAPDLYIACGISGAIQHWVGMMASKKVLAINTDAEAPMVTKADYAVIGDLHQVLPPIIDEVKKRKAGGG